jgi:large subunit ribosomal protein L25
MNTIEIKGNARAAFGKKATKTDRYNGLIPCVMYSSTESIHFTSDLKELRGIIYTPNFYKALVTIDGTVHEALLKEIQFHPITESVVHVDFHKLTPGVKVTVDIPIKIVGQSPGVKEGGKLLVKVRKLKVKSTPENLIDAINVDISPLKLGQSVKVKDIPQQKFEILNSPSIPLASIEIPRSLRSAGAKAEKK